MDGTKMLSMIVENLYFFDSLNFLPESKEHAKIIWPHMQKGVLSSLL